MPAEKLDLAGQEARLTKLYADALEVLRGLDELGLHQAGAYVSMALDALRRDHAFLPGSD
jgi:hypothetical protein